MCAVLVGLPDVRVVGVGEWPQWLRIAIVTDAERPACCERLAHRHGVREVELVDLPVFGRPVRSVWRKQRWRCPTCRRTWTEQDPRVASTRCAMTTRAGRWATVQVGRHGRSVSEVADDLSSDWHTVMDAVVLFGRPLVEDPARFGSVNALGLDEALFARHGPIPRQMWSTQIVDVRRGQPLDVVQGRDAAAPCAWLTARPAAWRAGIAGRGSISPPPTSGCSTRCSPAPCRSLTRSTSSSWRTRRSMSADGGCRTRCSATAAVRVSRERGPHRRGTRRWMTRRARARPGWD